MFIGFLFPINNEEESKNHSSQVRKMGDIASVVVKTGYKLNYTKNNNEPFRFDWNKKVKVNE
jgi:hypothetical protein